MKQDDQGCGGSGGSCCRIEAILSVDERGQMVLPKDIRERAGLKPGDKLALVSFEKDGQVCCFSLIKADRFGDVVKNLLGPMLDELEA